MTSFDTLPPDILYQILTEAARNASSAIRDRFLLLLKPLPSVWKDAHKAADLHALATSSKALYATFMASRAHFLRTALQALVWPGCTVGGEYAPEGGGGGPFAKAALLPKDTAEEAFRIALFIAEHALAVETSLVSTPSAQADREIALLTRAHQTHHQIFKYARQMHARGVLKLCYRRHTHYPRHIYDPSIPKPSILKDLPYFATFLSAAYWQVALGIIYGGGQDSLWEKLPKRMQIVRYEYIEHLFQWEDVAVPTMLNCEWSEERMTNVLLELAKRDGGRLIWKICGEKTKIAIWEACAVAPSDEAAVSLQAEADVWQETEGRKLLLEWAETKDLPP